jgi:hypothetical protein
LFAKVPYLFYLLYLSDINELVAGFQQLSTNDTILLTANFIDALLQQFVAPESPVYRYNLFNKKIFLMGKFGLNGTGDGLLDSILDAIRLYFCRIGKENLPTLAFQHSNAILTADEAALDRWFGDNFAPSAPSWSVL